MATVRPYNDVTISGWISSTGGSVASTVNESIVSDVEYVTSTATGTITTAPLIMSLDSTLSTIGKYYINIRAKATIANITRMCITMLDNLGIAVSIPVWTILTSTSYNTYQVEVNITSASNRIKIEIDDLVND